MWYLIHPLKKSHDPNRYLRATSSPTPQRVSYHYPKRTCRLVRCFHASRSSMGTRQTKTQWCCPNLAEAIAPFPRAGKSSKLGGIKSTTKCPQIALTLQIYGIFYGIFKITKNQIYINQYFKCLLRVFSSDNPLLTTPIADPCITHAMLEHGELG